MDILFFNDKVSLLIVVVVFDECVMFKVVEGIMFNI